MSEKRIIGRWYIEETLGKGGYSWVKKGKDVKTGKIVALKFMEKADNSWLKEQAEQVETEIEALKKIRHKNVMKLYAYNLNAQYPTIVKNQFIETILLVLEFAPGGELFDILYYTSKLEKNIARTYFQQFMAGLQACHNAGIVHRDLKPQNLLLDRKYNLKITDFGLSKIQTGKNELMKTTYVGTRGYQAPELLLKQKYNKKCDIFSSGVILFILLTGYPPFEQASKNDKWYKPLIEGKKKKFWKAHSKSAIANDEDIKDLLEKMLEFNPSKRASLQDVLNHKWVKGKILNQNDLMKEIRIKHKKAEEKRRKDVKKMKDLGHSITPSRNFNPKTKLDVFDDNYGSEYGIRNWLYAHGNIDYWTHIFTFIKGQIVEMKGECEYDKETQELNCKIQISKKKILFYVKIYRSKFWTEQTKGNEEVNEGSKYVYIVDAKKKLGDDLIWKKFCNVHFLRIWCNKYINGLPKWAKNVEKKILEEKEKENEKLKEEAEQKEENEDEYYKELDNYNKQKISVK